MSSFPEGDFEKMCAAVGLSIIGLIVIYVGSFAGCW
jgi:hypothetical protein